MSETESKIIEAQNILRELADSSESLRTRQISSELLTEIKKFVSSASHYDLASQHDYKPPSQNILLLAQELQNEPQSGEDRRKIERLRAIIGNILYSKLAGFLGKFF